MVKEEVKKMKTIQEEKEPGRFKRMYTNHPYAFVSFIVSVLLNVFFPSIIFGMITLFTSLYLLFEDKRPKDMEVI